MSTYSRFSFGAGRSLYAYNPNNWQAERPPFLCIHGWLDNHASFLPIIHKIKSLPWVSVDLIGHGQSSWRSPENFYSFQDYICDLALWIENYCQNQKIHLIGHSLGASIVSILAGLYPEKVESLILLDGAGPLSSELNVMGEQFRLSITQFITPRPLRKYHSIAEMAEGRKKRHNILLESCHILAQYGHIQDNQGLYQWGFDPKLFGLSPFQLTEDEILTLLSFVKAPTLFVRPMQGYPYPAELMQRRLSSFKTLEYVQTPGGHHAHLDHSEAVSAIIRSFYSSLGFL